MWFKRSKEIKELKEINKISRVIFRAEIEVN